MAKRIQYQDIAQPPVQVLPQPQQSDSWFQGWTNPVRYAIIPAMAVALAAPALAFTELVPPPVSTAVTVPSGSWSEPPPTTVKFQYQGQVLARQASDVTGIQYLGLSEPVRTAARDVWYQPDTFGRATPFPETVTEPRWHQPWSEPVRTPARDAWFTFTAFAPNPVVSFSYFNGLSEPVRTPPRDVWFQPDTLTRTQSDVTGIQYLALSEPVRTALRDAWYQPDTFGRAAPFPETVTEPRWHQPWSEPVRTAARDAWYQDATSISPFPITPVVSTALGLATGSWSQPPPSITQLQYQAQALTQVVASTAVNDAWFVPFTDPPKAAARDAWYQPDTFGRAAPFPEEVSEARWHQPWSEPVRTAPRDVWFTFTALAPNPVVPFSYYEPLSDPVRVALRDAWYQPDTLTRTASDVTGIQYPPLSEPVRSAPRTAWYQDAASLVKAAPFPEEVSEDRWHQPWSEPVRALPRDAWYQDATSFNPFPLPNTATPPDAWFAPFSDPVRVALRDVWFQPDVLGRAAPFPEEVSEDRWHQPWSEPVRTLPRDAWFTFATVDSVNPNVSFSYFNWLTEPVIKSLPRDAWFQPDTIGRPASDVTGIQYLALAEPIRIAPRDTWFQPIVVEPTQPVVSFSWFSALSEPVRTPPRAAWFQPDTLTRTASDVTGIQYPPLSEPVRTAPRDAWYQDATSFNPFPLPNAAVPPDSWLPYFDDFARPAARVAWNQYQSYADSAVVPPNTAINILQSWEPYTDPVRLPFPVAVYVPWDAYIDSVDVAPPDTGKVWRRYWIQDDPDHILNRDAPHDLVWAEEDEIAILIGML